MQVHQITSSMNKLCELFCNLTILVLNQHLSFKSYLDVSSAYIGCTFSLLDLHAPPLRIVPPSFHSSLSCVVHLLVQIKYLCNNNHSQLFDNLHNEHIYFYTLLIFDHFIFNIQFLSKWKWRFKTGLSQTNLLGQVRPLQRLIIILLFHSW